MEFWVVIVTEIARLGLRVAIAYLIFNFIQTFVKGLHGWPTQIHPPLERWPSVLVQLPLRNEFYTAERIIRHACALDYPEGLLQIQVLDDSDDATVERVRRCVDELAAQGHPITCLHRPEPIGFKAGAINAGLEQSNAELVAIFDADAMPSPDFLRANIPYFSDANVGFVQCRWGFANHRRNILTRLQALVFTAIFTLDQALRSHGQQPFQFNGTNGILRRSCLDVIGGFNGDIITEDVDVAFRAFAVGYRGVHRTDYVVPTELPEGMAAFRAQQRRWCFGSAQVLRQSGLFLLRSAVPVAAKVDMLAHLSRHVTYLFVFFAIALTPHTTLYRLPVLLDYGKVFNTALLIGLLISMLGYYGLAMRRANLPVTYVFLSPLLLPVTIGLSLMYSVAFLSGLVNRRGEFVRTPKRGACMAAEVTGPRYLCRWDVLIILEIGFGILQVYFASVALAFDAVLYSAFMATAAFGFLGIGIGSTFDLLRQRLTKART